MGAIDHGAFEAGQRSDLAKVIAHLKAAEQVGSGLVHSTATLDVEDPSRVIMFVVFESEEKARERENDTRRQEGLEAARLIMTDIYEGVPEFTDLTVLDDRSL